MTAVARSDRRQDEDGSGEELLRERGRAQRQEADGAARHWDSDENEAHGTFTVEDGWACWEWDVPDDYKLCNRVYRDPEGSAERLDQYLFAGTGCICACAIPGPTNLSCLKPAKLDGASASVPAGGPEVREPYQMIARLRQKTIERHLPRLRRHAKIPAIGGSYGDQFRLASGL